jgi:hypothetical protein
MLAWVIGFALIPLDAKLEKGEQHLAGVLRAHAGQLYAAALLAVLGAVLLVAFFAVLTRLVPEGNPGWGLLRVSLAGCVITQTMVAIGASTGLAGLHAAAGNAGAGLVALGWRALCWLTFLASGVRYVIVRAKTIRRLLRYATENRQPSLFRPPPWIMVDEVTYRLQDGPSRPNRYQRQMAQPSSYASVLVSATVGLWQSRAAVYRIVPYCLCYRSVDLSCDRDSGITDYAIELPFFRSSIIPRALDDGPVLVADDSTLLMTSA